MREYKKITFGYMFAIIILWFVALSLGITHRLTVSKLIYMTLIMGLLVREVNKKKFLFLNRIKKKYKSDLDVGNAGNVYEEIISNEYLMGRCNVLYDYLILLWDTCQFEEFINVYEKHRKMIRSRYMWRYMGSLMLHVSSVLKNRSDYQTRLSKYHFSVYHREKGQLSEMKAACRLQDKMVEILQLYEKKEYLEALQKIEKIYVTREWNKLYFQSIKERCLFHLKEEYSVPKQELTKYLFVKQWDVLVRTGEEYSNELGQRVLDMMKEDNKTSFIKYVFYLVITVAVLLWLL